MYCDWPVLLRCCFCMPLRRGVLVIAYLNALFCIFMIGIYSYTMSIPIPSNLVYHGTMVTLPEELCIVVNILELGFNILLIYGAHMKITKYVKIYYYYAISTLLTTAVLFLMELVIERYLMIELFLFGFAGFCIQLYLLVLVWSLLKKLEVEGSSGYENKLHQFVNGQTKIDANGVYNPSTIPHNADIV